MSKYLCLPSRHCSYPVAIEFTGADALNYNATAGDTARALPDVGNVCQRLTEAADGNFINPDGTPLSVTKEECFDKTRLR